MKTLLIVLILLLLVILLTGCTTKTVSGPDVLVIDTLNQVDTLYVGSVSSKEQEFYSYLQNWMAENKSSVIWVPALTSSYNTPRDSGLVQIIWITENSCNIGLSYLVGYDTRVLTSGQFNISLMGDVVRVAELILGTGPQ